MPKTKLQNLIFTIVMAFFMVYAMICYNVALNIGGMSNQVFVIAFSELIIMWPVAIILELFLAERLAKLLTFRVLDPKTTNPVFFIIFLCSMIVVVMCPLMSLIATILFKNAGSDFVAVWFETIILNFPMALGWQIFVAGPIVRALYRLVFERKTAKMTSESPVVSE